MFQLGAPTHAARRGSIFAGLATISLGLGGCGEGTSADVASIGDPKAGADLVMQLGCGRCHTVPGIEGANGEVGPPLEHVGRRKILAGFLANTPSNMEAWLRAPQTAVPGNAMPDMGLNERQVRDLAAYLYTLR